MDSLLVYTLLLSGATDERRGRVTPLGLKNISLFHLKTSHALPDDHIKPGDRFLWHLSPAKVCHVLSLL